MSKRKHPPQRRQPPQPRLPEPEPLPEADSELLMEFDTTEIVIPVKVKDKKGVVRDYILREASGDAACAWKNIVLSRVKMGEKGKPERLERIADAEPKLVSLCLFDVETGQNVPETIIRSWPYRIQKSLFQKCQEISDLDEEEATEDNLEALMNQRGELDRKIHDLQEGNTPAKNELEGTTVGS